MDSIFTKIIKREIPAHIIYEDDLVISILDISQLTEGHTLIICKGDYKDIYELPDSVASHMFLVAKHVGLALRSSLNCEGINLFSNNGSIAGQTVFHFHIHLIPRFKDDTFKIPISISNKVSEDEFKKRAQLIRNSLRINI